MNVPCSLVRCTCAAPFSEASTLPMIFASTPYFFEIAMILSSTFICVFVCVCVCDDDGNCLSESNARNACSIYS